MALQIKNLVKEYPGPAETVAALKDVSVSVEKGEFVAVVGPSGCGKTTLLLAAGALLRPTGGEVLIAGQDPYQLSPERRSAFRAERIGFVFQQFHLIPYLTVLENVLSPAVAKPLSDARDRAMALVVDADANSGSPPVFRFRCAAGVQVAHVHHDARPWGRR